MNQPGYGLDDQVSITGRGRHFHLRLHCVQTGYVVHPPSYPMGTGDFLPVDTAANA